MINQSFFLGAGFASVLLAAIFANPFSRETNLLPCIKDTGDTHLVSAMAKWMEQHPDQTENFNFVPVGSLKGKLIPSWCIAIENNVGQVIYYTKPYQYDGEAFIPHPEAEARRARFASRQH